MKHWWIFIAILFSILVASSAAVILQRFISPVEREEAQKLIDESTQDLRTYRDQVAGFESKKVRDNHYNGHESRNIPEPDMRHQEEDALFGEEPLTNQRFGEKIPIRPLYRDFEAEQPQAFENDLEFIRNFDHGGSFSIFEEFGKLGNKGQQTDDKFFPDVEGQSNDAELNRANVIRKVEELSFGAKEHSIVDHQQHEIQKDSGQPENVMHPNSTKPGQGFSLEGSQRLLLNMRPNQDGASEYPIERAILEYKHVERKEWNKAERAHNYETRDPELSVPFLNPDHKGSSETIFPQNSKDRNLLETRTIQEKIMPDFGEKIHQKYPTGDALGASKLIEDKQTFQELSFPSEPLKPTFERFGSQATPLNKPLASHLRNAELLRVSKGEQTPIKSADESLENVHESSRFKNENSKRQKTLKPKYEPLKHAHEHLNPIYELIEHTQIPLRRVYEPLRHDHEALKPAYESLRHVQEPSKPTYEPVRHEHEPLKSTYNPVRHIQEPLKTAHEYLKHIQEPLKLLRSAQKSFKTTHEHLMPKNDRSGHLNINIGETNKQSDTKESITTQEKEYRTTSEKEFDGRRFSVETVENSPVARNQPKLSKNGHFKTLFTKLPPQDAPRESRIITKIYQPIVDFKGPLSQLTEQHIIGYDGKGLGDGAGGDIRTLHSAIRESRALEATSTAEQNLLPATFVNNFEGKISKDEFRLSSADSLRAYKGVGTLATPSPVAVYSSKKPLLHPDVSHKNSKGFGFSASPNNQSPSLEYNLKTKVSKTDGQHPHSRKPIQDSYLLGIKPATNSGRKFQEQKPAITSTQPKEASLRNARPKAFYLHISSNLHNPLPLLPKPPEAGLDVSKPSPIAGLKGFKPSPEVGSIVYKPASELGLDVFKPSPEVGLEAFKPSSEPSLKIFQPVPGAELGVSNLEEKQRKESRSLEPEIASRSPKKATGYSLFNYIYKNLQ